MKYRLGRKSKRAILEVETGHEYIVFPQGKEKAAEEYCEYLNNGRITERNFYLTMFGCVFSIVLMAMIFSAFLVKQKNENEELKEKLQITSVHTSLPICKEK